MQGRDASCDLLSQNLLERLKQQKSGRRGVGEEKKSGLHHSLGISKREEMILQALIASYDQNTNAHARRTVLLAEAVAYQMPLPEEEIMRIRLATLLHDIGKAAIPRNILEKPGPLNDEELAVVKGHPQLGGYILTHAGGRFKELAPIVVAHHENWDGSGYPRGLSGEAIPHAARIIAVVDSYDVMTSRRSYNEPLQIAEACRELQQCAGKRYDPHIVAAFIALLEDTPKRDRATSLPESVGVAYVALSPRSDECVPASA